MFSVISSETMLKAAPSDNFSVKYLEAKKEFLCVNLEYISKLLSPGVGFNKGRFGLFFWLI